ncbi:hypothetical protein [Methanobacterium ferruginis]|uniref:hypothetical protein n=1 Tax=Methanobacterium ferruginis TaxID=710191 RepID=UPI0025741FED|nr:hypothetical protein [Methanobacterium ferruginis]BDZ68742.1 hypothetical protein GCM10025860_21900 [Methanobacterium ferruginis]
MGSVNKIECENCSFCVTTSDNFVKSVCYNNSDYSNELYCLNCQRIVKVWQRKNGKDMKNMCPECGSRDVFLLFPDNINVKCPNCKKGNLKSELYILQD